MMEALPATAEPAPAATLWARFAAPLRSFVAARVPPEVDPEDVLQDVFVRIQAQLPNLRHAERVDAWIFQIARNVVADVYRNRERREGLAGRVALAHPAPVTDDDERDAEAALASCLASIIVQLPEPYRQAIELTELRGMTQIEAARLVGVSVSGMKSRVQRGRVRLLGIIHDVCRVETDVRGRVIGCDPRGHRGCDESLRPSPGSSDSINMTNANEPKATETETTTLNTSTGCCGGEPPKDSNACCALDAEVKAAGGAGCGCGPKTATTTKKGCC